MKFVLQFALAFVLHYVVATMISARERRRAFGPFSSVPYWSPHQGGWILFFWTVFGLVPAFVVAGDIVDVLDKLIATPPGAEAD